MPGTKQTVERFTDHPGPFFAEATREGRRRTADLRDSTLEIAG